MLAHAAHGACLEESLAHAGPGSAHQSIQAEIVIGIKLGLHDIKGTLSCGIQAHEAPHVVQRQAVFAMVADVSQHLSKAHHPCGPHESHASMT